jgi:hypothetical protein
MSYRSLSLRLAILAVCGFLAASHSATGQNLLKNPHFTTALDGWSSLDSRVVASWSPLDSNGSASSGSVLLTQMQPAAAVNLPSFSQCILVTPGTRYTIAGRLRVPSGQAVYAFVVLYVVWYAEPSCAFPSISTEPGVDFSGPADTWVTGSIQNVAPPTAVSALFLTAAGANAATTLRVYLDDLLLAPTAPVTLTIPASASIHGQNGAFFHTDLWLENRSYSYPLAVTARHHCLSGTGQVCGVNPVVTTIPPRQTVKFADALVSLFGDPETAGAIELTYDSALGDLSAFSRVYTPSLPSPTTGAGIPALTSFDTRSRALFLATGSNGGDLRSGFRTNAGVYNPSTTTAASATFTLYAADGTVIGTPYTRTWQPNEAFQLNDIFGYVNAAGTVTTNATLVVTSTSPVFSYVTLIDNQSGDTTYVSSTSDEEVPL